MPPGSKLAPSRKLNYNPNNSNNPIEIVQCEYRQIDSNFSWGKKQPKITLTTYQSFFHEWNLHHTLYQHMNNTSTVEPPVGDHP